MKSKTRSELQLQPRRSSACPGGRLATQQFKNGMHAEVIGRVTTILRLPSRFGHVALTVHKLVRGNLFWADISCVWFVWARSIFELDVKGDIPYECDRAANRRPCGVLRSGNHCCLLAHGD